MTNAARIVVVFNQKGGVGKTTTTCQLAGTLGKRGYDVLVADMDPQQTAAAWLAMSEGGDFPATIWPGFRYGASVISEIKKLSEKYDIIISDCAPSVDQPTTWAMLLLSDLALIPTRLSPPDLVALSSSKRLMKKALEETGRAIPVRVLANAVRMHMNDDQSFYEQLREDRDFPPLKATLGDRRAYTRSMLQGATAHRVRGGEEAVREIEAAADEILKTLGLPNRKKGAW